MAVRKGLGGRRVTEYSDGSREYKLTDKDVSFLQRHFDAFREKFGRDPGEGDPIFFDPNADEPKPLSNLEDKFDLMIANALKNDLIRPELAYAMFMTRRIVTEENVGMMSEEENEEWCSAVKEYVDQSTERSKVFRVLSVEGSKVTNQADAARLMDLASSLGVRSAVEREIFGRTSN